MFFDHICTPQLFRAHSTQLFDWIAAGKLKVRIGGEYPLAEAAKALADMESRKTIGKLLLVPCCRSRSSSPVTPCHSLEWRGPRCESPCLKAFVPSDTEPNRIFSEVLGPVYCADRSDSPSVSAISSFAFGRTAYAVLLGFKFASLTLRFS